MRGSACDMHGIGLGKGFGLPHVAAVRCTMRLHVGVPRILKLEAQLGLMSHESQDVYCRVVLSQGSSTGLVHVPPPGQAPVCLLPLSARLHQPTG